MVKSNCLQVPRTAWEGIGFGRRKRQVSTLAVLGNWTGVESGRRQGARILDAAFRQHKRIPLAIEEFACRALYENIAAGVAIDHHGFVPSLDHAYAAGASLLRERLYLRPKRANASSPLR